MLQFMKIITQRLVPTNFYLIVFSGWKNFDYQQLSPKRWARDFSQKYSSGFL